jgi:hypothetical protein
LFISGVLMDRKAAAPTAVVTSYNSLRGRLRYGAKSAAMDQAACRRVRAEIARILGRPMGESTPFKGPLLIQHMEWIEPVLVETVWRPPAFGRGDKSSAVVRELQVNANPGIDDWRRVARNILGSGAPDREIRRQADALAARARQLRP